MADIKEIRTPDFADIAELRREINESRKCCGRSWMECSALVQSDMGDKLLALLDRVEHPTEALQGAAITTKRQEKEV